MENSTISNDKILEAASKCPQAKQTLEILFPEVFKQHRCFNLTKLIPKHYGKETGSPIFSRDSYVDAGFNEGSPIEVRGLGDFQGKSFFLSSKYNWELVKDNYNEIVLLPTKKQ